MAQYFLYFLKKSERGDIGKQIAVLHDEEA